MALTARVEPINGGEDEVVVRISGTGVGAADEVLIDLPGPLWRVRRHRALLVSGSASAIAPKLLRKAGGSDLDVLQGVDPVGNAVSPARHDLCDTVYSPPQPIRAVDAGGATPAGAGQLWWRPAPNGGADNVTIGEIYLARGWGG